MNITVIGLGYVGSVVAAGLAHAGHTVTGVDIDLNKISTFQNNHINSLEPGLSKLVTEAVGDNRLKFQHVSDIGAIIDPVIIICVGTPTRTDGAADLSQVLNTIDWIKQKAQVPVTIVMKSTVPPGTGNHIVQNYLKEAPAKYDYVMNPEFLREGQTLQDWFQPDRIVLGSNSEAAIETMLELYRDINAPVITTNITTAEMIKYSANAFLATKISFINKIAELCEGVGADIDVVSRGIGIDKRIGPDCLKAGIGYGGSCFPKDINALKDIFDKREIRYGLLKAVVDINNKQRLRVVRKLKSLTGDLKGKKIAVLGLAFKPGTDDIREAPALTIIDLLYTHGAVVQTYDPLAMPNAARRLPSKVKFLQQRSGCIKGNLRRYFGYRMGGVYQAGLGPGQNFDA